MNQNYNSPFFIFDNTGLTPDNTSDSFKSQFLKAYPTKSEAVNFAMHGGVCIIKNTSNTILDNYYFDYAKLLSVTVATDGSNAAILNFSLPGAEPGQEVTISVEYGYTQGGDGGGAS